MGFGWCVVHLESLGVSSMWGVFYTRVLLGSRFGNSTVEARKLDYDRPVIRKEKRQGTPACIVPGPYSNSLESSVKLLTGLQNGPQNMLIRITSSPKQGPPTRHQIRSFQLFGVYCSIIHLKDTNVMVWSHIPSTDRVS